MASLDKSEDEILGLETVDSSNNMGTGNNKTDEDISCIDEDMLLLNSPSPTPEDHDDSQQLPKSPKAGIKTPVDSQQAKSPKTKKAGIKPPVDSQKAKSPKKAGIKTPVDSQQAKSPKPKKEKAGIKSPVDSQQAKSPKPKKEKAGIKTPVDSQQAKSPKPKKEKASIKTPVDSQQAKSPKPKKEKAGIKTPVDSQQAKSPKKAKIKTPVDSQQAKSPKKAGIKTPVVSQQAKSPKARMKPTVITSNIHDFGDDDYELEIIDDDNDDVEEITDLNFSGSNSYDDEDDDMDEMSDDYESEAESESDESTEFMEGKISIYYCHGAFFLWNPDDVQMLREECRIVGKLVGSLPRAPQQNSHLGLPLQLMPEEVKLLVDIDAAVVVEEESPSYKTLNVREAAFENVRANNYKIQQKLYKESRKEDVKQRMNVIIAGKKAKKRKLKNDCENGQVSTSKPDDKTENESAGKKLKTITVGDDDADDVIESKDEEEVQEIDSDDQLTVDDIIAETVETSEKHSLVQIFTENPWKRNFRPCVEWTYPTTEREMLKYLVFKDLWGKGFYLTSGAKFGGDFLVYPGDPARFHSHYIAICKNQLEELPCLDVVTYGRQASNVRKTALLCAVDRTQKVFYTSLQWTGLS